MLTLHGNHVGSVFRLLGRDENAATYALGFAMSRSPTLRALIVERVLPGAAPDALDVKIALQHRGPDAGITDIEIICSDYHIVVEAKVGLALPSFRQLALYAGRMAERPSRRLVSVSAAPPEYAASVLPQEVDGVIVVHVPWAEVVALARRARACTKSSLEKLWLQELDQHCEEYVKPARILSNEVFVVSLSHDQLCVDPPYTWIDVYRAGSYFHPVGRSWPVEPPNFIGFRFDGKLQSIHHIDSWRVVANLREVDARWPDEDRSHFVYQLGPAMRPAREVKSNPRMQAMRVWTALDLLLDGSQATILDAVAAHKARLARA